MIDDSIKYLYLCRIEYSFKVDLDLRIIFPIIFNLIYSQIIKQHFYVKHDYCNTPLPPEPVCGIHVQSEILNKALNKIRVDYPTAMPLQKHSYPTYIII